MLDVVFVIREHLTSLFYCGSIMLVHDLERPLPLLNLVHHAVTALLTELGNGVEVGATRTLTSFSLLTSILKT